MLEEQLKKFGLSEKEAKTYITLLVLGESTANEVAKESGVNRSSAYVVLEALQKKGLVKASEGTKIQKFRAAPPEMLAEISKERLDKEKEIAETMKHIVPALRGVDSENKHSPSVKVYKGKEGVREVYLDIVPKGHDLMTFTNPKNIIKFVPDIQERSSDRISHGSKMRAIQPDNLVSRAMIKMADLPGDEVVIIPKNKLNLKSDFAIYGNTIAMVSPKEKFGLIIESKELADAMKAQFEVVWDAGKQIGDHFKL